MSLVVAVKGTEGIVSQRTVVLRLHLRQGHLSLMTMLPNSLRLGRLTFGWAL